jgi:hypothetical protein
MKTLDAAALSIAVLFAPTLPAQRVIAAQAAQTAKPAAQP